MTDINELAQRMKAAALKAIADEGPTWFSKDQLSHPDGIALHEADVEFIALASHENVLALVEALEAKGKQIDILRQDKDTVIDTSLERINKILSRAEAAEKRIAELEAREKVVIIKPPVIGRAYSALSRVWTEQEVRKACELAGIKLHIAAVGKGE